jgi:hypothetical protein
MAPSLRSKEFTTPIAGEPLRILKRFNTDSTDRWVSRQKMRLSEQLYHCLFVQVLGNLADVEGIYSRFRVIVFPVAVILR